MASERTYTETQVLAFGLAVWASGQAWDDKELQNIDNWEKQRQAEVSRLLRDHAAQPAPSPVGDAERMRSAANQFAAGEISASKLAEELNCDDTHGFKLYAHAFCAKDPTPTTTPGTFSESEVRDVVEHVRSGERACGYYGPSTSGLKDIIRDALDEVRRRRPYQLTPSPDHPAEEPKL